MAETKYPDLLPKTKKNKKQRTNRKGTKAPGGRNFQMPQVPQGRNQLFDPVKLQQGIADNQQEILQTPRAKQKNKDAQDPFKNGFFKSKEELYRKNEASQNADRIIQQNGAAERRNAVDVAKREQSNAQKLFAPATPDIQTDKAGNKLAMRNGMPVGYSGNPKGAASPMRGNTSNPNQPMVMPDGTKQYPGMTDAESAANRQTIQNVAGQFEPYQLPKPNPTTAPLAATPPMSATDQMMFLPGGNPAGPSQAALPQATPPLPQTTAQAPNLNTGMANTIPVKGVLPWIGANFFDGLYGVSDAVNNNILSPINQAITGQQPPVYDERGRYQEYLRSQNLPMIR